MILDLDCESCRTDKLCVTICDRAMSEQRPVVSPAEKHNITRVCQMSHTRDTGALKAGAKCAGLYTATAKDNTMRHIVMFVT